VLGYWLFYVVADRSTPTVVDALVRALLLDYRRTNVSVLTG
jgi:hypothetical protein